MKLLRYVCTRLKGRVNEYVKLLRYECTRIKGYVNEYVKLFSYECVRIWKPMRMSSGMCYGIRTCVYRGYDGVCMGSRARACMKNICE